MHRSGWTPREYVSVTLYCQYLELAALGGGGQRQRMETGQPATTRGIRRTGDVSLLGNGRKLLEAVVGCGPLAALGLRWPHARLPNLR